MIIFRQGKWPPFVALWWELAGGGCRSPLTECWQAFLVTYFYIYQLVVTGENYKSRKGANAGYHMGTVCFQPERVTA